MSNYVVIPTYNEAKNIRQLLNILRTLPVKTIIVDDNSPDGTAEIIKNEYQEVRIVKRCSKQGLGSACKAGIILALEDKDCQNVITSDADMSHNPKDIIELLDSKADISIGSRYVDYGMIEGWNIFRKMTSRSANLLVKILLQTKVNDNTTNFRRYNRICAKKCLEVNGKSYEWVISALVDNVRSGATIEEVPVKFVNRKQGKSKLKIKHIINWYKFIIDKAIQQRIVYNFKRLVYGECHDCKVLLKAIPNWDISECPICKKHYDR